MENAGLTAVEILNRQVYVGSYLLGQLQPDGDVLQPAGWLGADYQKLILNSRNAIESCRCHNYGDEINGRIRSEVLNKA